MLWPESPKRWFTSSMATRLYKGWNETLAMSIAKASGSRQFVADVSFVRRKYFWKDNVLCWYYGEDACLVGYFLQGNNYRIVGIGCRQESQGHGYASALLKCCEREVIQRGGAAHRDKNKGRARVVCKARVRLRRHQRPRRILNAKRTIWTKLNKPTAPRVGRRR